MIPFPISSVSPSGPRRSPIRPYLLSRLTVTACLLVRLLLPHLAVMDSFPPRRRSISSQLYSQFQWWTVAPVVVHPRPDRRVNSNCSVLVPSSITKGVEARGGGSQLIRIPLTLFTASIKKLHRHFFPSTILQHLLAQSSDTRATNPQTRNSPSRRIPNQSTGLARQDGTAGRSYDA
jgi:hypothetical protein